jgi:hypothetical protein
MIGQSQAVLKPVERAAEGAWRQVAEDMLIIAYVPEADQLSHEQALQLALERDEIAARQLAIDVL